LRDAAASGHAVLVSSHLLGEMETLADRLVVIDNGRLLGQWDVADLLHARSRQALLRTDDDERVEQALRGLRVPVTALPEGLCAMPPRAATPSLSPPTCSARWRPSPTASSSSTTAACSASGTSPIFCTRAAAKRSSAPTTTNASSRLCADCGSP